MRKVFTYTIHMVVIFILATTSFARDPDAPSHDYEYRDHQTVGGSKWTGGDTFVLCGVAVMTAMVFALPAIFDGEYNGRIASWDAPGSGFGDRVTPFRGRDPSSPLSPRDLTSDPIPVPNGWVLPLESNRKSGYPPFFKFPTRTL
jgi:hypothetical protein